MTVTARRPAVRRRPRKRRHYRSYTLSRRATFGTGLAAPFAGWLYLGEPYHWAGLAVMAAAGTVTVPLVLLWLLFILPAVLMGGPFRRLRIRHRLHHDRAQCKSAVITAGLRRVILAADRHRCLYCGITAAELAALPQRLGKDGRWRKRCLHIDHSMPWKGPGGRTTLLNMVTLCDQHNEIKLNWWRERNGYVWYRPEVRTPENLRLAEIITMKVRHRRWKPLRLLRIVWAMG
jgi:hypothetical protein